MAKTNHQLFQTLSKSPSKLILSELVKTKRFCSFFIDMLVCYFVVLLFKLAGYSFFFQYFPSWLGLHLESAYKHVWLEHSTFDFLWVLIVNYSYQVVGPYFFNQTFSFYILGLRFKSSENKLYWFLLRPFAVLSFIPINFVFLFNIRSSKFLQDEITHIHVETKRFRHLAFINQAYINQSIGFIDINSLEQDDQSFNHEEQKIAA